jgi:putative ABC transport system substrate-binding protein
MTGVGALAVGTVAKRLQMLHELVPAAKEIAFLRNPTNPYFSSLETRELQAATATLGLHLAFECKHSTRDRGGLCEPSYAAG